MFIRKFVVAASIFPLFLLACESSPTGVESTVTIGFRGATPAPAGALPPGGFGASASSAGPFVIEGQNGTLELDEIHLIVAEFELKRAADCDDVADDDDCEEFEAPPSFVSLALDGSVTPVVTQQVPEDVYTGMEFEVEDLEDDEEDDDAQAIQFVVAAIAAAGFTDWPSDASMLVTGRFTPDGGTAQEFRVFFEAEIEIELDFDAPRMISDNFDVVIDPRAWFLNNDTALDLSQFNGQVVEFEFEMENGFTDIDFDD